MSVALVPNGAGGAQGSISSETASQIINGVSPGNGNFVTVQGHAQNNTGAGNLLICTIGAQVYANLGGPYVPVIGPPVTPGFTWVLAGIQVSDTQTIADPSAQGGFGYYTVATAVYYILNASSMASSVVTTQTTTFQGTWSLILPTIHDEYISTGFEITEWSGVPNTDAPVVVTAKGISETPDGGSITLGNSLDLLIVSGNVTGADIFNSTGFGYTGLDGLQNINGGSSDLPIADDLMTQYMLNESPGTYDTEFSASDEAFSWTVVAVGFSPSGGTLPPTLISVVPPSGPIVGGTPVTLTGTNFVTPLSVLFDTESPTSVIVVSGSEITCVTPAHAAGGVPASVTTPFGTATLGDAYTYIAPQLEVSPLALSFSAIQGGSNPASQNVGVSNGTTGNMNWAVGSDSPWLTAMPGSGINTVTVAANVSIGSLAVGTYTGHLTFTATSGATNTPQVVTVTFVISTPPPQTPILEVTPLSLSFSATEGGSNPAAASISITNGDGGTLNWTVATPSGWLAILPASGTGNGTVVVSVSIAGLTAGTYLGSITVTAAGAEDSPQIVSVILTILTAGGGGGGGGGTPGPCVPMVGGELVNGVYLADLQLYIGPATALFGSPVSAAGIAVNESYDQGRNAIVLDFNNSEGIYARDLGVVFTWPVGSGTVLDLWSPSIIPEQDDLYNRLSYHFLINALGLTGWGHVRELNFAHNATEDLKLLLLFDQWPDILITIPNSGGVTTKVKVVLPPNKFKMIEGWLSSAQPFLLWSESCELKLGQWGRSEGYRVLKPFSG